MREWEKDFDREIGIIEGYKLCIIYEDQSDQDVENQVKAFIRKIEDLAVFRGMEILVNKLLAASPVEIDAESKNSISKIHSDLLNPPGDEKGNI